VFDATCPLVTKVHLEVARQCRAGRDMVLIGHAGHPEVEGTMGQWKREAGRAASTSSRTSTTSRARDRPARQLRLHDADHAVGRRHAQHHRQPCAHASRDPGPANDDICYATQNRQDAVRELTRECDLVLVVGSPNSSNSNRLRELAEREGVEAHLIDGASEIDPRWVQAARASASPPAPRARRAGARRDRTPARTGRQAACASCTASPRTWCSRCRRNCG
jgi:4-hydroxy-3-methylbut-2-enyl diphosphate reductase